MFLNAVCHLAAWFDSMATFHLFFAFSATAAVATDLALVIGLSVALIVFFCVTLLSVKIIRRKGRTQSIYDMANISKHDFFVFLLPPSK